MTDTAAEVDGGGKTITAEDVRQYVEETLKKLGRLRFVDIGKELSDKPNWSNHLLEHPALWSMGPAPEGTGIEYWIVQKTDEPVIVEGER